MPSLEHILTNLVFKFSACLIVFILVAGPTGMSTRRWFAPTATFFARMLDNKSPAGSRFNEYLTFIMRSSADARCIPPPHIMHPFVFLTTFSILSLGKVTLVRTSTVSAVPAGLEIALELDFGIV